MSRSVLAIFVALALVLLAESAWAWHLQEHGLALILTGFEIAFCAAVLLAAALDGRRS